MHNPSKLKIAIDIRHLAGNKTGKGWYLYNVINQLFKIDSHNQYILYTKSKTPPFKLPKNVSLKVIKAPSLLWHFTAILHLTFSKPDLFWAPTSFIIPAFAPRSIKTIITVHDLVALLFPENHNRKAIIIEKLTLENALKKAHHILSVSENTAKDIKEQFSVSNKKISIIPCAASEDFKQIPKKDAQNILKDKLIPKRFILAVGTLEPRKNLLRLIRAFEEVSKKDPEVSLVIAGGKGWQYKEIFTAASQNPRIIFLGYVTRSELIALYNLAKVFVFPSLYEGFGIPVLEAMKCGCPVIASNSSSIPEVVGHAATLIDPKSTKSISNAILKLIADDSHIEESSRASLYQSQKFSWHTSAEKLLSLIKKIGNK